MKILHTADWHLGKRLERFTRLEEQREVMARIVAITQEEDPDLVLVAGDLFDSYNPSSEAQELLYRTLRDLSGDGARAVVAIAGNHDSPDRVTAAEVLARTHGIILLGSPADHPPLFQAGVVKVCNAEAGFFELTLDRPSCRGVPIRVLTTPYANEERMGRALGTEPQERGEGDGLSREARHLQGIVSTWWHDVVRRHCKGSGINLMVTHLMFAADPSGEIEEPEGERSINYIGGAPALSPHAIPQEIQYVACGHLHRRQCVDGPVPVYYSGSPLSYSFAEAGQEKSVTIVEVDVRGSLGEEATVSSRPLAVGRRLLRYHASSVQDALSWLAAHPYALVELTITLPDYLSGSERRALHEAHDGIVTIVPVGMETGSAAEGDREQIDPNGEIETLFAAYFRSYYDNEPNGEVLDLLREILNEQSPEGEELA